jgi:cell division septum initiation protein DivIVA
LEIHAPHRPIHTYKEMAVHLALITVGVLIALSFEGVASWREHRALVREARLNLTNELRDNIKELSNRLQKLPEEKQNLEHALDVAQRLADRKNFEQLKGSMSVQLGFTTADLRSASRTTAEVTRAFGLMDYDEVKKYATVYGHQDLYMRFSSDAMQNLSRTLATVGIFEHPESASAREFEDCKAQIRLALAGLITEEQLGQSLLKEYQSVLHEH